MKFKNFYTGLSIILFFTIFVGSAYSEKTITSKKKNENSTDVDKKSLPTTEVKNSAKTSIKMINGDTVSGTLLKKDTEFVYLEVSGSILKLDLKKIKEIVSAEGKKDAIANEEKFKLYSTADLPMRNTQSLSAKMGSAVVMVKTPSGLGTGWFCNKKGYLVTNNHVVANETVVTVTMFNKGENSFEKKVFKKVKIVALDNELDLALLKIEEEIDIEYPQLYLGDYSKLQVGDEVFAIGNPFGLERSTSQGIVSKVARLIRGRLYIQTTAPINPGNSGGPLFNNRGEVVGVVNMGATADGLGFAIPTSYLKEFLDNVESFAYDKDNPNSGVKYMETPISTTDNKIYFSNSDILKMGYGLSLLKMADLNNDGVQEIVFVNNTKSEIGVVSLLSESEKKKQQVISSDYEDVNKLKFSERFKVNNLPVKSKISSLNFADVNGDKLMDIIFYGDMEGLSYIAQKTNGDFDVVQNIDKITLNRLDAIKILDIDQDGVNDIFVLNRNTFSIYYSCIEKKDYPLNAAYKNAGGLSCEFLDANNDGKKDIVFFKADRNYAAYVRLQQADRDFQKEIPLNSNVMGEVLPYDVKGQRSFMTLDQGLNRLRELNMSVGQREVLKGFWSHSPLCVLVSDQKSFSDSLLLEDLNADKKIEMIVANQDKNEFMVFSYGPEKNIVSSPSPRKVTQMELFVDPEHSVLFSYSKEEKLFGISRVENNLISFPQPINVEGEVLYIQKEKDFEGKEVIIWAEKREGDNGREYYINYADVKELRERVWDGKKGSIDVSYKSFQFSEKEDEYKTALNRSTKPVRFSFSDFNEDGVSDLIMFLSHSDTQNLYLGAEGGKFKKIINKEKIVDEDSNTPLIVTDIDQDGKSDVLLVKPGFVRILKVDEKLKLYTDKQFNWSFGPVSQLVFYENTDKGPCFLAVSNGQGNVLRMNDEKNAFEMVAKIDIDANLYGKINVVDVDGNGKKDLLSFNRGVINVLLRDVETIQLQAKVVLNVKLDSLNYWKFFLSDLDGDGIDEVLLFDSNKVMVEIFRRNEKGDLKMILRHRLYERTTWERSENGLSSNPTGIAIGDVDGNNKSDCVFILHDRIVIYLQDEIRKVTNE